MEVEEEYAKRQAILNNGELLLHIEHGTSTEAHRGFGCNMEIKCADRSKPRITAIALNYLLRRDVQTEDDERARQDADSSSAYEGRAPYRRRRTQQNAYREDVQGGVVAIHGTKATRSDPSVSCEGSDPRESCKSSDVDVSCEGSGGYACAFASRVPRCATRTVSQRVDSATRLASATP